jgi:hypothetical protein
MKEVLRHVTPYRADWAALPLHCFPHSTIVRVRKELVQDCTRYQCSRNARRFMHSTRDEPPVSCGNVGIPNLQHPACFASAAGVPQHPLPDGHTNNIMHPSGCPMRSSMEALEAPGLLTYRIADDVYVPHAMHALSGPPADSGTATARHCLASTCLLPANMAGQIHVALHKCDIYLNSSRNEARAVSVTLPQQLHRQNNTWEPRLHHVHTCSSTHGAPT